MRDCFMTEGIKYNKGRVEIKCFTSIISCVCVYMLVDLTLCFDPLSVSHQAVFEVRSSADDGVTADHTALDVTPGNHKHMNDIRFSLYY